MVTLVGLPNIVDANRSEGDVVKEEKYEPDMWGAFKAYITTKRLAASPDQPLPLRPIPAAELQDTDEPVLYRLGHSTMLIRLDDEYVLTDPVFSKRASPVQWVGPKRFHPAPLGIDDLPDLKAVVISHDHYDHLDKASIKALSPKVEKFVTPLRVGQRLQNWGISEDQIIELDWWEKVELGNVTLTATPAQHFSGRGLFDKDHTLWASWVIQSEQAKLFFSGDSGYFDGFKEIGDRLGPFDVTMMEMGAYNESWADIHMLPEQSVQAHLDLKGKAMLPIHNSTFDLSLHDWYEPLERARELAEARNVHLLTPVFGEQVSITEPQVSYAWWRPLIPSEPLQVAEENLGSTRVALHQGVSE